MKEWRGYVAMHAYAVSTRKPRRIEVFYVRTCMVTRFVDTSH
jgi:hypothetical protein